VSSARSNWQDPVPGKDEGLLSHLSEDHGNLDNIVERALCRVGPALPWLKPGGRVSG